MSLSLRALKFENFNKQDISKNSNKIAVHVDITRGRVYAIKGGFFQLVVLSGKTPGRVLNLKKKNGEGFTNCYTG